MTDATVKGGRRKAEGGKLRLALAVVALLLSGCRQDMHNQPKFIPLREGDFFEDHRSARPLVEGTVARGDVEGSELLYTGKIEGQNAVAFPFAITPEVMARGQERFNIFCSPCHSRTGNGDGMVVRRGFRAPPSFHIDRLREAPAGHFFDVITNGFGAMPDYRQQVPVNDRWAIVAYIRALQASTAGSVSQVPADKRDSIRPPQ
ncbi:MAG: c-type cytochrome [Bacteroidales bacterium]